MSGLIQNKISLLLKNAVLESLRYNVKLEPLSDAEIVKTLRPHSSGAVRSALTRMHVEGSVTRIDLGNTSKNPYGYVDSYGKEIIEKKEKERGKEKD